MRAIALLGPSAGQQRLAPFLLPGVELTDDVATASAALVFGGDGTLHRHLPALAGKLPVLPVPVGSGNDFAANLGIASPEAALRAWCSFVEGNLPPRPVDLAAIIPADGEPDAGSPERLFCNIAGVGLDADANRRANAFPAWLRGRGGYVLAALAAIRDYQPCEIHIALVGGPAISGPAWLAAFANCPTYGGGMRIAPGADPADGLLDVCFVRRTSRAFLLRFFPTVFRGSHTRLPQFSMQRTTAATVTSARPLPVYADGEYAGHTPFRVEVRPHALQVIAPPPPAASSPRP